MSSKEQRAKEKRITDGVKEILEFRGFQIKNTKEDDDFLDIYADKISEEKEKITAIARFPKNPQIGVKLIRLLGKLQEEEKLGEALLIAESPLTHYAKKESVKLGIEIISSNNPLFNIFDHYIVRQHIKLKSPEIKYFLERYQIEKNQIPKILESDAAVKAIQAKPGDVIKIVRNPDMGENGSYYRVVIKSTSRLRLVETGTIKKKTTRKIPPKKPKETPEKPVEEKTKTAPSKTADKTKTAPSKTADKTKTAPSKTADKTKKVPSKTVDKTKKVPSKTAAKPKKTPSKTATKSKATTSKKSAK